MAVSRRVLSASALVAAGVAAAAFVGQLPALGAPDRGFTVTPSSPGQSLVCPGPVVAVGAEGTAADEPTATGRPSRTAGTAEGGKVDSTALTRGGLGGGGTAPRLLRAEPARTAGQLAGAQLEQVSGGDAAGLAASACTAPAADAWFAAGATTTGRTTVLLLANPTSSPARVDVRVWTEDGAIDPTGGGIAVRPRSRAAVPLAGLAPSAGGLALHVVSSGARIGMAVEQRTVRGLESGGVDITGTTAAPALTQTIPGLRISGGAAVAQTRTEDDYGDLQPVVRVLLPGARAADVDIVLQPAAGGDPVRLGRRVAAGVVTDFPVPDLPDGTYTARLSSKQPFVAGARVSVVGDPAASATPDDGSAAAGGSGAPSDAAVGTDAGLVGGDGPVDTGSAAAPVTGSPTSTARGIDLAWLAAAQPIGATAAVAVVDAPSPVLTIAGDGTARTVRVSGAATGTVKVPAKGTAALPVARGVVVLQGGAGTTAAVSYGGTAAVAGYPVEPADQEARPVRITR
ncbi:DUF5719 family protein [Amnibacterium endophyticum]|uniref:DUF5719 family protein n=1 Tax=Amnibacterium endophyticum TaxID=2109337 RepID=A0ABW4LAT8_9MICO